MEWFPRADHRAALIQPALTRRASDVTCFRGMNPTANMNCPYGTGEPRIETSFLIPICV